jgi:DNA invertase Pin-like site-specific DNA recombinase
MTKQSAPWAGVYRRCSEDRNDQASVSEQEELGLARCETEGWQPRLYEDNDRSASRYAQQARDDWPRLQADLRAGLLNVVWLWESSRGDRKLYEWAGFLEDCRDRKVLIYVETHGRSYDMTVPRDWKTLAEDGVNNAYASDETSQRVRRSLDAAARKGRPHGLVHYGYIRRYDPVTRKYVSQDPHPDTGPVAAEIITRAANGDPVSVIARDLDERGVRPPKARRWSRQTVREIALNPEYTGCRRLPGGEFIRGWTPIVSIETHLGAVAVLGDVTRSTQRPGRQRRLLSYLARCRECGEQLVGGKDYKGRPQYRCATRGCGCIHVSQEWLDGLVTLAVCNRLAAPDAAELYRGDDEEAGRHRARAAQLRAELDEWAASDISARAYQIKEAATMPKIRRAERDAAAAEKPFILRDLLTADYVRAEWDALGIPAQRIVIRILMDVCVTRAASLKRADITDPVRVIINWEKG